MLVLAVALGAGSGASALTLEDWPIEWRPDWFNTINPDDIAFAVYDYKLTTGFEGQHTDLLKGPFSLFDETQSGICGLEGDWTWVAGTGWTAPLGRGPTDITYHWKNVRVETNKKQFRQLIDIGGNGIPDCDKIEVSTENGTQGVTFNVAYHQGGNRLGITATIVPQPDHVYVKVPFKAGRGDVKVDKGWVLDQCVLIPEPGSLALLAVGALFARRRAA